MICVLTCPRPVNHLADTLRSIDESATSKNRFVVSDSVDIPSVPAPWFGVSRPKPTWDYKIHNRFPFWSCLELAVQLHEDLIFFEDDIQLCKNGAAYAEQFIVDDSLALVSLFAPFADMQFDRPTVTVAGSKNFAFFQGAKIPLRTCEALWDARNEMKASRLGGSDTCVGNIGHARGWKIGTLWPSIVQHIGDHSVVSQCHLPGRIARSFDATLDALTLPLSPELR